MTVAEQAVATPPSTTVRGLTSAEASGRRARFGPNEIIAARRFGWPRQLLKSLVSPLTLILLAASAVSAATGRMTDTIIIAITVLLGTALDVFQTARSDRAMQRLRERVVPTASALRDGTWIELPRRDLVPDDAIRLAAGDMVPADAQLVHARGLHVQQAALTGESLPVEKAADPSNARRRSTDPNDAGAVFLGTSVVSGVGIAIVTATGPATSFGAIAARLQEAPPPSALEQGLQRFGALLAETVIFLVLFLVLVSIALHRDALESLLFAVALAVGIVPEFMPMVTSITLATGAVRMARRHVIVKHLAAIHNLGSIDVLCSDKTGTLTMGEMTVVSSVSAAGPPSDRPLELANVAAHLQTGVENPLDSALRSARECPVGWAAVDEVPLDLERRRASIVAARDQTTLMIVKGAPEHVLAVCTGLRDGSSVRVLDDAGRTAALDVVRRQSARGLRVIGVASRDASRDAVYTADDERDLVLEGWIAFSDPPLADVADAVARLAADGVVLKILTGDDPAVATSVCSAAGIAIAAAINGPELERVSDAALGPLAERTTLFARVTPQQKHRIILALKARGHVVGYMGDGINDAPSLHAADVGISVAGAVDVARDAADVVLLERGLDVLHTGIVEGRKAFGNLMKYVLMGTSSNFGNMFSMAVASLVVPFLPMLPTQILLNNFLYDLSQVAIPTDRVDDAYVRKPHHWNVGVLRRFMVRIGLVSSLFDVLTFAVLLTWFHSTPAVFRTGWFVESLLTQTLVLLVIRTAGNPLRNRPSVALGATVAAVALLGIALPYLPIAAVMQFTPPPPRFLLFVAVATIIYLAAAEAAKRRLVPDLMQ
jgi:Mg2+-importing ATPase